MTVSATNTNSPLSSISQSTNPSQSSIASTTLGSDFQSFLKMLTTQLQNQDPTSPLDTNQFTQQLAALSTVEQTIQVNKNLETLIAASGGGQLNTAVGFIGKIVEATGNKSVLTNHQATFLYDLPAGTKSAQVSVLDAQGQVVFSGNGSSNVGRNVVTWDGVNSLTGVDAPNGIYSIVVKPKDAAGKDLDGAVTHTVGIVTSVDVKDGKATVSIGDINVPMDTITSVKDALTS